MSNFLLQEIRYELSLEKPDTETYYIISDASHYGQWAWDQIAPSIYNILKATEPKNLSNLDDLLKIIQGSTLPTELIDELASQKCHALENLEHVARWFAVWAGVTPASAIKTLKTRIEEIDDSNKRSLFAMTFITHLLGDHRGEWCCAASVCNAGIPEITLPVDARPYPTSRGH